MTVVSLISSRGSARDANGNPYPYRRQVPYLIVAGVLVAAMTTTWIVVGTTNDQASASVACDSPTMGTLAAAGDIQPRSIFDSAEVTSPEDFAIRVLNANGERGQASIVGASLNEVGFHSTDGQSVANDAVYTSQDLDCYGQLRFGEAGRAAAATVALAVPCMEYAIDGREDSTIDVVLGTYFNQVSSDPALADVMAALAAGAEPDSSQVAQLRSQAC